MGDAARPYATATMSGACLSWCPWATSFPPHHSWLQIPAALYVRVMKSFGSAGIVVDLVCVLRSSSWLSSQAAACLWLSRSLQEENWRTP